MSDCNSSKKSQLDQLMESAGAAMIAMAAYFAVAILFQQFIAAVAAGVAAWALTLYVFKRI